MIDKDLVCPICGQTLSQSEDGRMLCNYCGAVAEMHSPEGYHFDYDEYDDDTLRPLCPRCGTILSIAEGDGYDDDRGYWECEECGYNTRDDGEEGIDGLLFMRSDGTIEL